MGFLLFECVTCCTAVSTSSSSTEDPSLTETPRTEETRSLVAVPKLSIQRRRKRTVIKGAVADWKPSLFAISEDNSVSTTPQKVVNRQQVKPVVYPRNGKHCGPSAAQVNASTRSHEFGGEPLPMVFPAFTAAPFMF